MRARNKQLFSLFLAMSACLALAGCQFLRLFPRVSDSATYERPTAAPEKSFHRVGPYVFLADFTIDPNLPLFQELAGLRDEVYSQLHLPNTNRMIKVYLFESRDKYDQYINSAYPNLPKRRAFFVAQPVSLGGTEDLLVYTYWGDRIQQDLRHELTHALLHSVLADVPLWLDEGLAEYFETPASWKGVNYNHLKHLVSDNIRLLRPNMDRLEKLTKVDQMSPGEYRESWAWVHFMLNGPPQAKQVLLSYLQELRTNADPGSLRPRLQAVIPNVNEALRQHLAALSRR